MSAEGALMDPLVPVVAEGLAKAASALAAMLEAPVDIYAPELESLRRRELGEALGLGAKTMVSAVEMEFGGDFQGSAQLLFLSDDAGRLAECLAYSLGLDARDPEALLNGTLSEVGNIVINAILGTIANAFALELSYTVPLYLRGATDEILPAGPSGDEETVILVRAKFHVASVEVWGDIAFFLSLESIETLTRAMRTLPVEGLDG